MTRPRDHSYHKILPLTILAALLLAVVGTPPVTAAISTVYGNVLSPMTQSSQENTVVFHANTIALDRLKPTDDAAGSRDWYLDIDNNDEVSAGDVRLNQPNVGTSYAAGSKVKSANTDIGRDLRNAGATEGVFCYVPTYVTSPSVNFRGSDRFNPDHPNSDFRPEQEPLYVQVGSSCGNVAAGADQFRITSTPASNPDLGGYQAATRVAAGNEDVGNSTVLLTTHHSTAIFRFVDLDKSGGISSDDPIYLSLSASSVIQPRVGDIRLFAGSDYTFGSFTFGSVVEADDYDAQRFLTTIAAAEIASDDATPDCSSGTLQDNIWVDIDGDATVEVGDVLLAEGNTVETDVGKPARQDHDSINTAVTDLTTQLAYYDANADTAFNYGDVLYLDVGGGSEDDTIGVGDIRLSDSSFGNMGTCVTSGNTDIGSALVDLTPTLSFFSVWNHGSYQPGDLLYVGSSTVGIGHVRWFSTVSSLGGFGDQVDDDDVDRHFALQDFSVTPSFCYLGGSSNYRLEDPVYLSTRSATCAENVKSGDVRISGTGTYAAGANVRVGDNDFNDPLSSMPAGAKLRYLESGDKNSGGWDHEDEVYLDADGSGASGSIQVADVRITGPTGGAAGTKVESGQTDLGITIRDFPTVNADDFAFDRFKFLKTVPSTGSYSSSYVHTDIVVYDTNDNDLLDHGDIFFTGTGGATTLVGSGGSGTTTNPQPTQTATNNPTASFSVRVDHDARMVTVDGTGSTAVSGRTISSYTWVWGDGSDTSTGRQATHVYSEDGRYTIRLTVEDSAGATDTELRTVRIGPEPTETPTESPTETPTESPVETPTESPTESPTDTATNEPQPTPAPGLFIVLTLLAAIAVAIRRRGTA